MSTRSICAIVWNFLNIAQKCCRRISWLRNRSVHLRGKFEALLFIQVLAGSPRNFNSLTRTGKFYFILTISFLCRTSRTLLSLSHHIRDDRRPSVSHHNHRSHHYSEAARRRRRVVEGRAEVPQVKHRWDDNHERLLGWQHLRHGGWRYRSHYAHGNEQSSGEEWGNCDESAKSGRAAVGVSSEKQISMMNVSVLSLAATLFALMNGPSCVGG